MKNEELKMNAEKAEKLYQKGFKHWEKEEIEEAGAFWKEAAALGHKHAPNMVNRAEGAIAFMNKEYEKAVEIWKSGVEQGFVMQQALVIGHMYTCGKGVPVNLREADRWFELAMHAGNVEAIFRRAALKIKPQSEEDEVERICLMHLAVEKGHEKARKVVESQECKGYEEELKESLFQRGCIATVLPDVNREDAAEVAVKYWTMAAKLGHEGAVAALDGVKKNRKNESLEEFVEDLLS